jgi:hypothetical protein
MADTVTDVLRLACAMSDGDMSLQAPARLRSFSRHERRILLAALDAVVAGNRARLGDVAQYAERWKRLGERLHPHEYPQWPGALEVFAVARGQIRVPSAGSRVEAAMRSGDVAGAAVLLARAGQADAVGGLAAAVRDFCRGSRRGSYRCAGRSRAGVRAGAAVAARARPEPG